MPSLKPITLITGASAGIGAALAEEFAEQGHALVLVARREPQLRRSPTGSRQRGRARPLVLAIDLRAADATGRIAAGAARRAGSSRNIVVNNAGFGLLGPAAELDRASSLR